MSAADKKAWTVTVIVPCYRSSEALEVLVQQVSQALRPVCERWEILLVEDCSPDRGATWALVRDLGRRYENVRCLRLLRNSGQHNALLAGIREATCDVIVTMDDDLQNPPEEILRLIQGLDEEVDLVYGAPLEKQHGVIQNLGSFLVRLSIYLATRDPRARHASSFRAFYTDLRDAFADYKSPFVSIDALLSWGSTQTKIIGVQHNNRYAGRSNYTFWKLFLHAVNMIAAFSVFPLQIASGLGIISTLFGAVLLVGVLIAKFIGVIEVPGFTFIIAALAIFSGSQMATLGILGVYIGRIYGRVLDRPPYVVRSREGGRLGDASGGG
jgi:glycosyltransferase involved in cell wall biosynthesis